MLFRFALFSILASAVSAGEGTFTYQLAGKNYTLNGGTAAIQQKNGKLRLVIGVKDQVARGQLAITAELPTATFTNALELNSELAAISAIFVNTQGIYSVAPHITLARDDFMRYTKKEEIETSETEEDPDDFSHRHLSECTNGASDACARVQQNHGKRRRKKIRVRYVKHAPTWVGKTRSERIASGDGIMKEEKYRDTSLVVRLTPVLLNGKVVRIDGTFAGVLIFNEGMKPGVRKTLQNGQFSVGVQSTP